MEIHHLKYVLRLADRLHFSQAADDLRITQPSLSQQIILLEKELGVKLFDRKTRSVELTPAGEDFVAHAETVIRDWQRLQEAMRRHSATQSGYLRIGTLVNMALLNLNHHLQAFQNQYANILLNIVEVVGSGECVKLLESEAIDLAFAIPTPDAKPDPRFASTLLVPGRVVAILPAGHPLADRPALELADLIGERIIFPARVHSLYNVVLDAYHRAGYDPKIIGSSSQVETGIDLAAKGFGIALLSSHFTAGAHQPGVVVIPIEPLLPRDIVMVYARKTADSFALNAFIDSLTAAYADWRAPA